MARTNLVGIRSEAAEEAEASRARMFRRGSSRANIVEKSTGGRLDALRRAATRSARRT